MPHKGYSPRTLDLFEVALTIPTPSSEPTPVPARPLALAGEVRSRLQSGQGRRPELEALARQVGQTLKSSVPRRTSQATPAKPAPRAAKGSSLLQEGQRKAVRAVLLAGVAPGQIARQFGLPRAAASEMLREAP